MKILLVVLTTVLFGCFQDYETKDKSKNFDQIDNPNFNWKSFHSSLLEFSIPDGDPHNHTLVEVFHVSNQGKETKTISQFLKPGESFSKDLSLANHIVAVKVKLNQGFRERVETITLENLASISAIYFDASIAKGVSK